MAKVLGIGDPHNPVVHPGYIRFCQDIGDAWDCDTTVIIGDVADNHAISFHAANPMCPGPCDEFELTKYYMQKWYTAFPDAFITIGNHDERVMRLAQSVGIPSKFLRNYSEVWDTPNWKWEYEHEIDDVCYLHGTARSGVNPAWTTMQKKMMSVVMGHCHSRAGVKIRTVGRNRYFALDTGCGIDVDAYQFAYGKHVTERPVLGAAVIIDGIPYYEVMPCSPGELYHKSNFKSGKK